MKRVFALGLIPVFTAVLFAADGPVPAGRTLAITGATVRTQTDAADFVGVIVIRDGKIAAMGKDVAIPAGATVIDAAKCVITPGLIDAHGMLGLHSAAGTEAGREATLNILDAVDPFSDDWKDAAKQGVTAVYAQPGATGSLGGSGAVLRVCRGDCADELSLKSPAGIQAMLGASPAAPAAQGDNPFAGFGGRRGGMNIPIPAQPAAPAPVSNALTRFAQYETLFSQFDAAKKYGEGKITKHDLGKDLILKAIKGEIPVRMEIHYEDDLRHALKLAGAFNLKLVFEHMDRAKPMPEEIHTSRASLVVGPFIGAKSSGEVRTLALDGRRFAIGTFGADPRATAGLRLHAAAAVAAGYPREAVLKALTADAADLLGVGDKLGRIAVGRPADLVVFAGDPLDPSAAVRMTISQGHVTYDTFDGPAVESAPAPVTAKPELPEKLPDVYVIKTTRILTSSGQFTPGEIQVVNGKIYGVRHYTANEPVFDLGDAPVTPALVAANITLPGETAADADAAHLRATDGLTADDAHLRSCRDHGFLTAMLAPGSANVLAGVTSMVRIGDSLDATDVGMKFVLTSTARLNERFPVSLAGQFELIDARLRGEPSKTSMYLPPAVQASLLAQRDRALDAVRAKRQTAYFEAQTRTEVRAALRLIAEHKLKGVLLMPREIEELSEEIHQANVGVIVAPAKPQDAERTTQAIVALAKVGVPFAFGGDAAELRNSAAWLVNAGLPRAIALRALIGQPAEAFGFPATTGRLAQGDPADFVVWTGDPLNTTSRVAAVVNKGQRVVIGTGDDEPAKVDRRPGAPPARGGRRGR